MKGYIYHITNKKNNKKYIGQTINYEIRKNTHLRNLRNGKHHSEKLQRAWNKYGEDSFEFSVQEVEISTIEELYYLEIEEIKKFNSYFDGYNMTIGGEGSVRKHFSFEDYCFIRIGNLTFEAMYNKTAKYFNVDITVIADIINNKTYLDYLEQYEQLSPEVLNLFKEKFIRVFNIDINNPPKILNKKKVDDMILRDCLCILQHYDRIGKALEEKWGYAKGSMSALRRRARYPKAWELFEELSEEEVKKIADEQFVNWEMQKIYLNRQTKQGGSEKAYSLTKEDYYYAFYLQEHGKSYTEVATLLGVKPATVKDWFNGRSRKKEKTEYKNLSIEKMEVLKSRNKAGTLNDIPIIARQPEPKAI